MLSLFEGFLLTPFFPSRIVLRWQSFGILPIPLPRFATFLSFAHIRKHTRTHTLFPLAFSFDRFSFFSCEFVFDSFPWFLAEQYTQSIDTQITTTNSTGAKYRASSVGGSSTSSGSPLGISDEGFSSSSSSSMSATGPCKGRAGRSDDHHRSEMKSLTA